MHAIVTFFIITFIIYCRDLTNSPAIKFALGDTSPKNIAYKSKIVDSYNSNSWK
jgi:hypothetical protein